MRRTRCGPPLAWLAAGSLALLMGALAIGVALGGIMPLPYRSGSAVLDYIDGQRTAVQVIAVGVFASSVLLGVYAAAASSRMRQLGASATGAAIALGGGLLAAASLGLAGLLSWVLSRPEVTGDAAVVHALYLLVFLTGGISHIVALGLLLAAMAVASLTWGLLPRALACAGVVIAGIAEAATLVLVWPEIAPLLPVARLGGLVWLIVAGALLSDRGASGA